LAIEAWWHRLEEIQRRGLVKHPDLPGAQDAK